ncbi:MAG: energy transducer TonB [Gammaproteobacteria bacterium]|nr:energy transducer TonB [Gammaproteobacteria bacterium]
MASLLLHGLLVQAMEQEDQTISMSSDTAPGPISVQMLPTVIQKKPEPVVKPEPAVTPEPMVKPTPKPEPKPAPVPKPKPKPAPKPTPQPAPKSPPAVQPAAESPPPAAPATRVEPKPQPVAARDSTPKRIETPSFKTRPAPIPYPSQARRRGLEGTVLIEVWLDERGKQLKRQLVRSSGVSVLDKTALKAIAKWRFSAYLDNGRAIAHRVQIPIRFKLD